MTAVRSARLCAILSGVLAITPASIPGMRHASQAAALVGDWAGRIDLDGEAMAVRAAIAKSDSAPVAVEMDLIGDGTSPMLRDLRVSGDSLIGTMPSRLNGPAEIRMVQVGDTLRGEVTRAGHAGSIRLLRLAQVDTAAMHQDEGLYVAGVDTFIANRVTTTLLVLTEPHAHALRILFPVGPNAFIAGPALFTPLPEQWRVRFRNEQGDDASLDLTRAGRTVTARRVPLAVEEVRFANGPVSLAGAFIRPRAQGRYPVVVYMHGSGESIRTSHLGIGWLLAAHGIAALMYDKRGSGGSTGSIHGATIDQLADDAVAGAEYLLTRPDVDTNHVGFFGISEGGTTSEVAAQHFRKSAFVIPVSGGSLPFDVWELLEGADQLRTDGTFSSADTAAALAFQRARDRYARTRSNWDEYHAALNDALKSRWYGYNTTDLFGWSTASSMGWDMKAVSYFYDPLPELKKVKCPVLNLYGEYDVPAAITIEVPLVRKTMAEAGNRDVTVSVIPRANHNFFTTRSGNAHEMDRVAGFAPEFFPTIAAWLERRVGGRR